MRSLTIFKTLLVLTLVVVGIASRADAAPISYTIDFTGGTPLPTSGSFKYDPTTPNFTDFLVQWNGVLYDLTNLANAPLMGGVLPCLGGTTGAEATFHMLSDCASQPNSTWSGQTDSAGDEFRIHSYGPGFTAGIEINDFHPTDPQPETFSYGTWSITEAVPEPSSFIPITLVGVFIARKRIGQGLRLATRKNR
jgi:hypothetical protein